VHQSIFAGADASPGYEPLPGGHVLPPPASKPVKTYTVRVEGDEVFADCG
jgi:hypothetical protein